jgi:hypothetical protein
MTSPSTSPSAPPLQGTPASPAREISLNDVGRRYVAALQRLSDLMCLTWTGAHTAQAAIYDQVPKVIPGLPTTEFRLPFAKAQEEAERWWLQANLNEVLGLLVIFIDDVRKLCALVDFNVARASGGDMVALAAEVNAPPARLDLPTRLKQLKARFNVVSPVEAEILSLGQFTQALLKGAPVAKESVLRLQLKCAIPAGQAGPTSRLDTLQRSWGPGDRLMLTREQHAAVFTTASLFIGGLLNAVQEYAKSRGLAPEPTLPTEPTPADAAPTA